MLLGDVEYLPLLLARTLGQTPKARTPVRTQARTQVRTQVRT